MSTSLLSLGPVAEVRPYKVEDVLRLAREGRIRIPAFQRPPRWRSGHVIKLFESVLQGFPLGTLLFAKRDELAGDVRFGPFVASAPATRDALIVVDGQQRISALVGALLHPAPTPRGDVHALWLDLESLTFVRATGTPPETWVPLNVLGDSAESLRWMRRWTLASERDDLIERMLDVGKRIREFQLSCAIVAGDDEPRLRQMFERLNTSGVGMKEEEVFAALHAHNPDTDLGASAARVASVGFGDPSDRDVRQCLLCVGGFDPGLSAATLGVEEIRALLPRTERAMVAALRFLALDASIPHLKLLPYRVPLRILARFFDRCPNASGRARTLLRRWVWRGALSGLFATSSQARVRFLQKLVEGQGGEQIVQALLRKVGSYSIALDPLTERRSSRSARSLFLATALLARGPLRPRGEGAFAAEDLRNAIDEDDEHPATLRDVFVDVAQRAVGPLAGCVLVEDQQDLAALAEASDAVLESHLIPLAARDALRAVVVAGDEATRLAAAVTFDALRAPALMAWSDQFLRAQCEPEASDRVSIASLIEPFNSAAEHP